MEGKLLNLHLVFDFINSSFELLAGVFVLNHCRVLRKEKEVKGVSLASIMFFSVWGFWNIIYYPALNQWCSFIGGIFITAANLVYSTMIFYYRAKAMGFKEGERQWNIQLLKKLKKQIKNS